jgi:hypothetical protein
MTRPVRTLVYGALGMLEQGLRLQTFPKKQQRISQLKREAAPSPTRAAQEIEGETETPHW